MLLVYKLVNRNLVRCSSKLLMSNDDQNLKLYLFAKTYFTDACKEKAAKGENVTLVTAEEMF